ncbi:MAG TPA: hypothetical protein VGT24_13285 [Candidatus Acidoferrales bacterium]|nr:hypothetical protein [Candidatus Acidoferrales bacterium]
MTGDFKPTLYCDGEELARIENGTYFQISAPAGLHNCTAEPLHSYMIEVNVLAGNAAYVHVKLLPGIRDHAALANTTEDEYNKEIARLKPLKEWSRDTLRPARAASVEETPAIDSAAPPAINESDAGTAAETALRVIVTRRKAWLASGGFNSNRETRDSQAPDFAKDFHKGCPKAVIAETKDTADYAVTIDEIGLLDALTGPSNEPTFRVSVYRRNAGLLYSGGTSFLKNAVKDACNAIGAK